MATPRWSGESGRRADAKTWSTWALKPGALRMNFDWQENGFAEFPSLRSATGNETLFRAWGGDPKRKWGNSSLPGVCFSLDEAKSRQHAEVLYSVLEYRNLVRYLTRFRIDRGTPLWVGRVHPGDPRALLGNVSGNQVLIERAYLTLVHEITTTTLPDDLGQAFVFSGSPPRLPS
jgi:hypothetical protein